MRYDNITIKGSGSFLPAKVLHNTEIEKSTNGAVTPSWIFDNLGIGERRQVNYGGVSDLGYYAALKALEDANLEKEDIDLIIVATSSPERISPSTACTIHKKLGILKDTPCFDINAVCAGFVYAMGIAAPLISTKTYKNILVIGTEAYSKITDYTDRNCVFFGDGAGAMVLSYSKKGWMEIELNSNGGGTGSTGFTCPLDTTYSTNPKEVWNQAIKVLPSSIESILSKADLKSTDISMFIPHQASIKMLKLIASRVGLSAHKVKTVMHKYGNIAGASVPIAFDEAKKNNEIRRGDNLLFTAIGSGWSWGSIVINYE